MTTPTVSDRIAELEAEITAAKLTKRAAFQHSNMLLQKLDELKTDSVEFGYFDDEHDRTIETFHEMARTIEANTAEIAKLERNLRQDALIEAGR